MQGNKFNRAVLLLMLMTMAITLMQGCSKPQPTDAEYVEKAKDYHDEGKLNAAVIEVKNALRKNPDNAEARWLLGSMYLEVGNGLAAEKELTRAAELGVSKDAVIPLLLEAFMQQADYRKVLEQDVTALTSNNVVAEAQAFRGSAYLFLKDQANAEAAFEKAILLNPNSVAAITGQARLALVNGDNELATQRLEKALSINNLYAPAWSVQGDLMQLNKNVDGALDAYSKAVENRYNNGSDLLKRALLYMEHERFDEAQKDVNQLKMRFPKHSGVNYAQGVLYFTQKKYQEALPFFQRSIEGSKDEFRAVYYLGATQYLLGNHEQAKVYLGRYLAAVPGNISAHKLLALIALSDGDYKAAQEYILPLVKNLPEDTFSINILANALLRSGQTEEALGLFKKIVELEPESAKAYAQLSMGLLAQGDLASGRTALKTAIELDPKFQQAEIMLVLSYLRDQDYDKAQQAAEDFISRQPENVTAYTMLGSVLLSRKEEAQAEKAFEKALSVAPGDPIAAASLATLAQKRGDIKAAKAYYKDALDAHPGHLLTMMKLADLQASQNEQAEMVLTLQEAIKHNPEAAEPRVLLAREYLKEGRSDQASVLFTELPAEQKDNPYVLGMLGEIQLSTRDYVNAKLTLQRLVALHPGESQSHFLLAKAYKGLKDNTAYKRELEKAISISPEHVLVKIALGQFWLVEGDVAKANEYLSSLKKNKELEASVELRSLEAGVLAASGKTKQALAVYEKLFADYPNSATLMALSDFQWSSGDKDGSTAIMESWLLKHADDVRVRLSLANKYIGLEKFDKATKQYQKVLDLSSNSLLAMNNLAWYLRETNPEQALTIAEKANEFAPESAVIMDTIAIILLEKGDSVRAERFINRALDKYPTDPTLLYHRALIHEKTAKVDDVIRELKALLKEHADFPERNDAEKLLKKYESM